MREESVRLRLSRAVAVEPWRQLARVWPTLAAGAAVALLLIAGAYGLSVYQGVPPDTLTGDPAAITDSRWWLGLLSNLGIMMWAAATGMCAVGTYFLYRSGASGRGTLFLLASTGMCLALALDDAFMLHEEVLPAHLRISERVTYGAYAVMMVAYVVLFRRTLRRTDYVVLLASLACYAASIAIDLFTYNIFVEDAFKFAGIVFWLLYYARTVALVVEGELGAGRAAGDRTSAGWPA